MLLFDVAFCTRSILAFCCAMLFEYVSDEWVLCGSLQQDIRPLCRASAFPPPSSPTKQNKRRLNAPTTTTKTVWIFQNLPPICSDAASLGPGLQYYWAICMFPNSCKNRYRKRFECISTTEKRSFNRVLYACVCVLFECVPIRPGHVPKWGKQIATRAAADSYPMLSIWPTQKLQ